MTAEQTVDHLSTNTTKDKNKKKKEERRQGTKVKK